MYRGCGCGILSGSGSMGIGVSSPTESTVLRFPRGGNPFSSGKVLDLRLGRPPSTEGREYRDGGNMEVWFCVSTEERTDRKDEGGAKPPPSRLYIGTAGWAYSDWNGIVYPAEKPKGWHALDLLSCYFNVVEVDSSFYRIPSPTSSKSWARRMAGHPDFLFTAKLWEGFTHRKEIDLPEGWLARRDVDAFRAFLEPLAEAERLGCVLAQFPWSFRPTRENQEKLERLIEAFREYPLAVEVRHATWYEEGFLKWLAERRVAFTNIDQPIFGGSLGPTDAVTADFYYVRLHGRNREAWFSEDSGAEERYDYLYKREELAPWVERIEGMQTKSQRGFVITNNHFRGQGVTNALELSVDLKRPVPPPPESLARVYPVVRSLPFAEGGAPGRPSPPPEQLELF